LAPASQNVGRTWTLNAGVPGSPKRQITEEDDHMKKQKRTATKNKVVAGPSPKPIRQRKLGLSYAENVSPGPGDDPGTESPSDIPETPSPDMAMSRKGAKRSVRSARKRRKK
jgi:hypothetical protein